MLDDLAGPHVPCQTLRRLPSQRLAQRLGAGGLVTASRLALSSVTSRRSRWIYEEIYCARGEVENRIKELHALEIDRTSCSRFWANQLRVLLTAAAYVPMQKLRRRAAGTAYARAQVTSLRERLFKLGARVVVSARRMVLHLPAACPSAHAWRAIAIACGASSA